MKTEYPLLKIKDDGNPFVLNIYLFQNRLIGIEEDQAFLQLFEMDEYGTPTDYFYWRYTKTGFSNLLDVKGKTVLPDHPRYKHYRLYMMLAESELKIKKREWGYRLR